MLVINSLSVKEIIHRKSDRGEVFIVHWGDNTSTTVKLAEGDNSDDYLAFLYALGKKIFGNKGVGRKLIRERKEIFENKILKRREERMEMIRKLNEENSKMLKEISPYEIASRQLFRRNK